MIIIIDIIVVIVLILLLLLLIFQGEVEKLFYHISIGLDFFCLLITIIL